MLGDVALGHRRPARRRRPRRRPRRPRRAGRPRRRRPRRGRRGPGGGGVRGREHGRRRRGPGPVGGGRWARSAPAPTRRPRPSTRWSATTASATSRFGWASARLDDVLAWVPARVTAALGRRRAARTSAGRCSPPCAATPRPTRRPTPASPRPPSPPRSASSSAGRSPTRGRIEHRALLGSGPVPTSGDIARAVRLSRDVSWLLAGSLAAAGPRRGGRGAASLGQAVR